MTHLSRAVVLQERPRFALEDLVESFSLSSDVQDESSLARLLDRLGPEHRQEE